MAAKTICTFHNSTIGPHFYSCFSLLMFIFKRSSNQIFGHIWDLHKKLCMQVEKDYTNKFPKSQVHKLCGRRDIYIQKCVIFGGKSCYFYIPNALLASDVVCIWLLIGQSQSVIVIVIGQ